MTDEPEMVEAECQPTYEPGPGVTVVPIPVMVRKYPDPPTPPEENQS
jgi:hypothetical protein